MDIQTSNLAEVCRTWNTMSGKHSKSEDQRSRSQGHLIADHVCAALGVFMTRKWNNRRFDLVHRLCMLCL